MSRIIPLAQVEQKFTAKLSGEVLSEVPPTNTKAAGTAEFTPNSNGEIMSYTVDVNNIDKLTMADIHQGKKGENGPVVVTLIRFKSLTPTGPVNGQLIESLTPTGPVNGQLIDS